MFWRVFNFTVRRVVATCFMVVGLIIAIVNVGVVLPGGTINVNGVPSTDIVLRIFSFAMPLFVAAFGIALFRAPPFAPPARGPRA